MASVVAITAAILVALILFAWVRTPHWFARPLRRLPLQNLGLHVVGDDVRLVEDWSHAISQGVAARLNRPRGRWLARCEMAAPKWRPQVLEGAAFGCGALRMLGGRQWRELPREILRTRPQFGQAAYFGFGLWGAWRFGRNFEDFLKVVQCYDPWWRFVCLDGYGFKFGLFDYPGDHRSLSHLHAIPGYYRRAAFQGVGRAFYFAYLSDRRGLIETISDFAPQHDGDLIEGAAFASAYYQPDRPRRALNFVRAMPFEWRANAHLGITLGFRARATADADYFEACIIDLPRMHAAAIHHAVALAGEMEEQIRREHRTASYGLWREKLTQRMQHERLWDPAYVDAETRSGGEGAVR